MGELLEGPFFSREYRRRLPINQTRLRIVVTPSESRGQNPLPTSPKRPSPRNSNASENMNEKNARQTALRTISPFFMVPLDEQATVRRDDASPHGSAFRLKREDYFT